MSPTRESSVPRDTASVCRYYCHISSINSGAVASLLGARSSHQYFPSPIALVGFISLSKRVRTQLTRSFDRLYVNCKVLGGMFGRHGRLAVGVVYGSCYNRLERAPPRARLSLLAINSFPEGIDSAVTTRVSFSSNSTILFRMSFMVSQLSD